MIISDLAENVTKTAVIYNNESIVHMPPVPPPTTQYFFIYYKKVWQLGGEPKDIKNLT